MRIPLPAVALGALVGLAGAGISTAVLAQALPPNTQDYRTQDYCYFRSELYSFGAIICIGKNRGLRCDGPDPPNASALTPNAPARTSHWTLLQSDTLWDACNPAGPVGPQ